MLNALAWLRIFTTTDSQLLKNAPALPFFGMQADVPFIPFYLIRPGGDSCGVREFSSLLAEAVGRGGAIARDFSGWAESGLLPALVCAVVRAQPFQMAEEHAFPAGIS